jgi:hypothetical protein
MKSKGKEMGSFTELPIPPPEYIEYAAKRALEAIASWRSKWDQSKREKYNLACSRLHKNRVVTGFLLRYYDVAPSAVDAPIFRIGSNVYHLYVEPGWTRKTNIDEALAFPLERNEYSLPTADPREKVMHRYMDSLKQAGRIAWDAQTFRLMQILTTENGFKLQCAPGRYSSYLGTCEIMSDELLRCLHDSGEDIPQAFEPSADSRDIRQFKMVSDRLYNRMLHAHDREQLLRFQERDCKIGINVFLVLNTKDGPICLMYRRGKDVAEYPEINHVMPAGTFQHDSRRDLSYNQYSRAYSLKYKVLSELWEECFEGQNYTEQRKLLYEGVIDLEDCQIPGKPELFPIRDVMVLLAKNRAFVYATGLGIDMLAAKPELTVLLVIDDPSFATKYRDY